MVIWGSILVRTWDANNDNTANPGSVAATCDGDPSRQGRRAVLPGPAASRASTCST